MRLGVAEILEKVDAAKAKDEKIAIFHKHSVGHTTLFEILRMAFDSTYPKWHQDLGKSRIDHKPNPYVDQQPSLMQGMRHLKRVFLETTEISHLSAEKRKNLWVQFVESLDNADAKMLETLRVTGKLPYKTVTRKLVVETFPGLLTDEEVQKASA